MRRLGRHENAGLSSYNLIFFNDLLDFINAPFSFVVQLSIYGFVLLKSSNLERSFKRNWTNIYPMNSLSTGATLQMERGTSPQFNLGVDPTDLSATEPSLTPSMARLSKIAFEPRCRIL